MIILTNCSLQQATNLKTFIKHNKIYLKIHTLLKLILLSIILWFYLKILLIHYNVWPTTVSNVVRELNYGMIMICFICINVHSLRKNCKYNELIDRFEELDISIKLPKMYYNITKRQIKYFFVFLISTYALLAFEKILNEMNTLRYFYYPVDFYVVFCIPLFPSAINLLNFLVFVTMIKVRLEYINETLRIKSQNQVDLKTLRDMCALHMKLNELTMLINDVFGISLVASVGLFFVVFLSGGYTIIFAFKTYDVNGDMYQMLLTSVVYNYPYLFLFWWICYCCRRTNQEVK